MIAKATRPLCGRSLSNTRFAVALLATTALGGTLAYANEITFFLPGNLLLSRSVYNSPANIITPGVTQLPPNCVAPNCVTAVADGTYPTVFNNVLVDASFGITSKIVLDQMYPYRPALSCRSVEVPNSAEHGVKANRTRW